MVAALHTHNKGKIHFQAVAVVARGGKTIFRLPACHTLKQKHQQTEILNAGVLLFQAATLRLFRSRNAFYKTACHLIRVLSAFRA